MKDVDIWWLKDRNTKRLSHGNTGNCLILHRGNAREWGAGFPISELLNVVVRGNGEPSVKRKTHLPIYIKWTLDADVTSLPPTPSTNSGLIPFQCMREFMPYLSPAVRYD